MLWAVGAQVIASSKPRANTSKQQARVPAPAGRQLETPGCGVVEEHGLNYRKQHQPTAVSASTNTLDNDRLRNVGGRYPASRLSTMAVSARVLDTARPSSRKGENSVAEIGCLRTAIEPSLQTHGPYSDGFASPAPVLHGDIPEVWPSTCCSTTNLGIEMQAEEPLFPASLHFCIFHRFLMGCQSESCVVAAVAHECFKYTGDLRKIDIYLIDT